MIIQSSSPKEKVAFNSFRLILLFAFVRFFDKRYLGGEERINYIFLLSVIFLDAVLSVLIFYLVGRWMKRKQLSVSLSIRGKNVVVGLLSCFMIITIPILLINYWHYFNGSWSGTYAGRYCNDKVVLNQHYFCYNDVVEADFKVRDGSIVLDLDSIRIKENSSDFYTDSQKQQMLDEVIFLAENDGIDLRDRQYEVWFTYNISKFTIFGLVSDSDTALDYTDNSWSGTYVDGDTNDKVILDQNYFCYNDVVEAEFKLRESAIVLDIDSIRIKENSSDIYTDSQKQQMLDEIIFLAENNGFHLSVSDWEDRLFLYHGVNDFNVFDRAVE